MGVPRGTRSATCDGAEVNRMVRAHFMQEEGADFWRWIPESRV